MKDARKLPLSTDHHFADGQMYWKRTTVSPLRRDLPANSNDFLHASREILRNVAVVLLAIRRGHQQVDVLSDNVALLVSEESLRASVKRLDAALAVDHDDAVDCRVNDRPPTQFAGLKRHVRLFPSREVASD